MMSIEQRELTLVLTVGILLFICSIPIFQFVTKTNDEYESKRYELLSEELEVNEKNIILEYDNGSYLVNSEKGDFKVIFEGTEDKMKIDKMVKLN